MYRAGHAIETKHWIRPDTLGGDVYAYFARENGLRALAVADENRIGLLSRDHFFLKYGAQYGQALFEKRPIGPLANYEALSIEAQAPLGELMRRVHERPEALTEGFLVTHQGR